MRLSFEIGFSVMQLRYAPVAGRRTFYGFIRFGKHTLWVQRWSAATTGQGKPFAYSRDRLMSWTGGLRTV